MRIPSVCSTNRQLLGIERGGLGQLAAGNLSGGPVGPPARWAATSNVEGGSGTEEGAHVLFARDGGLYSDKLFARLRVPSYATTDGAGLPH